MLNLTYPSNLPSEYQGVQLVDVREKLPVNKHYTWAQLKGIRPITDLTTIVFHHDGISKASSAKHSDMQLMSSIANTHIRSTQYNKLGDPGFPYDIYIRSGNMYFTNYIEPLEYGVASNNKYTVNVCVAGDYANYDTLTDADRKALYVAFFMLKGVLPSYKAVLGHKQLQSTQCPGYDMDIVRRDLQSIEAQMQFEQSTARKNEMAFSIGNQILYLMNLMKGKKPDGTPATPGEQKWAEGAMLSLHPYMKERGLVK